MAFGLPVESQVPETKAFTGLPARKAAVKSANAPLSVAESQMIYASA
jgi:hypothetical protein